MLAPRRLRGPADFAQGEQPGAARVLRSVRHRTVRTAGPAARGTAAPEPLRTGTRRRCRKTTTSSPSTPRLRNLEPDRPIPYEDFICT